MLKCFSADVKDLKEDLFNITDVNLIYNVFS